MIKPLGGMVLLEKIEVGEKTTATGLVLSGSFAEQGPKKGVIVAMGNGEQNYLGDIIPIAELKVGHTVFYPDHAGTDIEDEEGKKYLLITSKNILAVQQ